MQQPENRFISSIHKLLSPSVYHEKMHNMYRGGTPDVYYSGHYGDMWVEYKYLPTVPVRAEVQPKELLSMLQQNWLRGRYSEGRKVAVIIGCPKGAVIFSGLEWESNLSASEFSEKLCTKKEIADWIARQTLGASNGNSIPAKDLLRPRKAPSRGQSTTYGV